MGHENPRVVIIADDLTGAMDGAVPFARRGLRVVVVPDIDKIDAGHAKNDVLSISTNSRHSSEQAAVNLVSQAFRRLSFCKPDVLIKKIDSTLRGNVVAESCALLAESGRADGVVCPAVPAQSRSVVNGNLLVDGILLCDTAIGKDLRSKPPGEPLPELFANHGAGLVVRLEKAGEYRGSRNSPEHPAVVICDAVDDADLTYIVKKRELKLIRTLFIGASGLTEALAGILFGPVKIEKPVSLSSVRALFVIGSLAPETKRQVDELQASPVNPGVVQLDGTTMIDVSAVITDYCSEREFRPIVIKAPELIAGIPYEPDSVAKALALSAESVLEGCDIELVVGTGGDTVHSILEQLDCKEIRVYGEIEPGVVYGSIEIAGKTLWLVTKAGGFGERDLFLKILQFFII